MSCKQIGWSIAIWLDTTKYFVPEDRDNLKLETVLRLTRHCVLWHREAMKPIILYGLCSIEHYHEGTFVRLFSGGHFKNNYSVTKYRKAFCKTFDFGVKCTMVLSIKEAYFRKSTHLELNG